MCPLVELAPNTWLLELFHGPTLAFKDVALQLLARLLDAELERRGERVAIVLATSGDTGSAAIEACRDRPNIDIFVFHPEGRVSEVQRRQMTTVTVAERPQRRARGHVRRLSGHGEGAVRRRRVPRSLPPRCRELDQLGPSRCRRSSTTSRQRWRSARPTTSPVSFAVPTGNFGNVLSGWVAKEMGLPIDRLIIGSNRNDILTRVVETGTMKVTEVVPTMSPSMDIQVSSNFERLLFELNGRDGGMTAEQMALFRSRGSLSLEADQTEQLRATFDAARVRRGRDTPRDRARATPSRASSSIRTRRSVCRPRRQTRRDPDIPVVALATAHPAKFPDAVERAIGVRPAAARSARRADGPARALRLVPADLAAVEAYIAARLTSSG